MNVPDLSSDPIGVAIRSGVVYLFLVVALRLGGKREIGQLTIPDLVVLLLIANGVQNAMVGSNATLVGGLVSGVVVILLARGVEYASDRWSLFSKIVVGEPRVLVQDGSPLAEALRDEEISEVELATALRQHGLERPEQAKLVMLEIDGSISVIPKEGGAFFGGGEHHRAGRIPVRGYGRRGGGRRAVSRPRRRRGGDAAGTQGSG